MRRPFRPRLPLGILLSALPLTAAEPTPAPPARAGVPVARVAILTGAAEQSAAGRSWEQAQDGFRLKTGDRLRTGPESVARIEFPWTAVNVGPASTVWIPGGVVLSTVLEEGRVELRSDAGEIIKLRTAEAQVRGRGHVVVRRAARTTLVSVLDGAFRVEAQGRATSLARGQGAVVEPGRDPSVLQLAPAPERLTPGVDPSYIVRGAPVTLSWSAPGPVVHLQILAIDSEVVLLEKDLKASSHSLVIPWLGTFRWRVSQRDSHGMDGVPSLPGFVCVVEK